MRSPHFARNRTDLAHLRFTGRTPLGKMRPPIAKDGVVDLRACR